MIIKDMFAEDINRPINGVIKVDQDVADVIEQEVREYVITKELKRHFISFFDCYSESFEKPTADIGVWLSGFFGSGKSHLLKMLSYILENKNIGGTSTVEMFRKKFEDDPATFMLIDRSTRGTTETILFNIDIESSINKNKTAVLRVFAKMFYSHLGYYGENLKVVKLEQYLDQLDKTEEFRRVFKQKKGKSWLDQRKAFAFNRKSIIPTLTEVLDMSEEDAERWFDDKTEEELSIASLVEDIKAYVNAKPGNFRLLFMIDEVGQYVGTDTDMLLNLQSLIEKIGSECGGKVWVVCTGQEAIDEIIKVRSDEFSRIQARFKIRLSLSSSSVDEVIQKRVLQKKPEVEQQLENIYNRNDSVLRNLFSFSDSIHDIKGFSGPNEFAVNFPFVPYQFIIMQKVFAEIRKHGNSGKHLSGGERSMLSGFQEAAQKIQHKDEHALVPFFRFYDTVHSFLDSSIRRVIERCQKAADNGDGIEPKDVDILKLLYLIRYVDDIPANVNNIVILMADDIRSDKVVLRAQIRESLERLQSQNYIGRRGELYNFLTDEEQDIQREINNTFVDTAAIIKSISEIIFADIYTAMKFRYGQYDFSFDKIVDDIPCSTQTGGMKLHFLTAAADETQKTEFRLMTESKGQAIVALADSPYYERLENALKISNYVKKLNVNQLPKSVQEIIRAHQDEAECYEQDALEQLKTAIQNANFYVDGDFLEIKSGDAKSRLEQALHTLVERSYRHLNLITENADKDEDIISILTGTANQIPGAEPNRDAATEVEEFLVLQDRQKLPTSMADVQKRYQSIPYGWKEIDIAAVVALLIYQQKVTIKYGGATIQPNDPKLPDMLRKKNEIGKTSIAKRQVVTDIKMKDVKALLREYFDTMDVPDDEDGLVAFIVNKLTEQKKHYEELLQRYAEGKNYPDKIKVSQALELMDDVLSQQKDNIALIDRALKREDDLLDSKEALQYVEGFFKNQVQIFDAASQLAEDLKNELEYLPQEPEADQALQQIRQITAVQDGFNYKKIPDLNQLMKKVREGYERLLAEKRTELLETAEQCLETIHQAAGSKPSQANDILSEAETYFNKKKQSIGDIESLALLDSLLYQMGQYKDKTCHNLESLLNPPADTPPAPDSGPVVPQPMKNIKSCNRQIIFPAKKLESQEDIDTYVEQMRKQLTQLLKGCDGIQLK